MRGTTNAAGVRPRDVLGICNEWHKLVKAAVKAKRLHVTAATGTRGGQPTRNTLRPRNSRGA